MIDGKKILAVIPARGGSVGVPRKNLKKVKGRPLIAWTIDAAHASKLIDRTVLSSEDDEIRAVASDFGCETPFVRPAAFARDDSPASDVINHALDQLPGYDYVVMLNPTTPLRTADDIDGCIARCIERGAPACVSVAPAVKHPAWMFDLTDSGRLEPVLGRGPVPPRRQDLSEVFVLNGAVYVVRVDWFRQTGTFFTEDTIGYEMPPERSIDVDSNLDFMVVEAILDASRSY